MASISLAAAAPSGLTDLLTGEVLPGLEARLQSLTAASDAWMALLSQVYDAPQAGDLESFSERAERLRQTIATGGLSLSLELRSGEELQGGLAAYTADAAGSGERIYLNADWAATASAADLERALLEELGHAFDQRLNLGQDTRGDEGEAFASLVLDGRIDPAVWDESGNRESTILELDGVDVSVEFANYTFVNAYEMVYDINNDGSIVGSDGETPPEKEQSSINFITKGLGNVKISDGSAGLKFSGNDVSASAVVIGGKTFYGWISRPIKANGTVRGFYFWTDTQFASLSQAQADGNQDLDGPSDNRGFVLVVDQAWFNDQISATLKSATVNNPKDGNLGAISYATVSSSSDRVDSALNGLAAPPPFVDSTDTDKDGVPDVTDIDDDNDGITDLEESRQGAGLALSPKTLNFNYAQNTLGFQSFHSAALVYKTGDRNDPALLFDGDINTELRVHTDDVYEFGFLDASGNTRTIGAGSSFSLTEGPGTNDAKIAVLASTNSTDSTGNVNNATGGGKGWQTIKTAFASKNISTVFDLETIYLANGSKPLVSDDGSLILLYAGASDSSLTLTTSIPVSYIQLVGLEKHGGWADLSVATEVNVDLDTDGDGIPNRLDLDSDNDGISDLAESVGWDPSASVMAADTNRDGTITKSEAQAYMTAQGGWLGSQTTDPDFNKNGLWDFLETSGTTPIDSDKDGVRDFLDLDSDGDGIPDTVELQSTGGYQTNDGNVSNEDRDRDGVIARFDANDGSGVDLSGQTINFGGTFATPVNTDASGEILNVFSTGITKSITGATWLAGGAEWKGGTDYKVLQTKDTSAQIGDGTTDGYAKLKPGATPDNLVVDFGTTLTAGTQITIYGASNANAGSNRFFYVNASNASGVDVSGTQVKYVFGNTTAKKVPETFTYTVGAGGLRYLEFLTPTKEGGTTNNISELRLDYVAYAQTQTVGGKPIPDYLDRDSDGDGLLDRSESGLTLLGVDANSDGIDDGLQASYLDPDGKVANNTGLVPFNTLKNTDGVPAEVDYRSVNFGVFSVSNVAVNEGSPYAVFTISDPGVTKSVRLQLQTTGTGKGFATIDPSGDIGSTLQYLNPSGAWVNYTAGSAVSVDGSRNLLVRVQINNDLPAVYEGPETFRLLVTQG